MIPVALSMRHRYKELSMPIVIMAGAKDRVVKDSQAVRLHEEIPNSLLRLNSWCWTHGSLCGSR